MVFFPVNIFFIEISLLYYKILFGVMNLLLFFFLFPEIFHGRLIDLIVNIEVVSWWNIESSLNTKFVVFFQKNEE